LVFILRVLQLGVIMDKEIRIAMIDARVQSLDMSSALIQENINTGSSPKEGGPSFEQMLGENLARKEALLALKKEIQDEI